MRQLVVMVACAIGAICMVAEPARAQNFTSKVIDTEKLVVKPTDTATSIIGGTTQYVSRVVAGTLDNHGIVRTLNNLFGRKDYGQPVQGGISPLPPVSSYPSNFFKSPIQPVMPKYMTLQR